MTLKQKVEYAIALLEKGWCKEVAARDIYGDQVCLEDPTATHFCLYGALSRAGVTFDERRCVYKLILGPNRNVPSAIRWNDAHNQEEVIAKLKSIIPQLPVE